MDHSPYMPKAKSQDWETPWWLFAELDSEFQFTVDGAATRSNAKMDRFWTEEIDGLAQDWTGESVFINPPFRAADLRRWVEKAWISTRDVLTKVVMIVPVKSDQDWWHEYAIKTQIRFIRGRVIFEGAESSFPGPIAVLVFGREIRPVNMTLRIPRKK